MIGHSSPVSGVAAAGSFVATSGYDNKVVLWDAERRLAIGAVSHDHLANQCVFSADGRMLASAGSDYTGRIWSIPDLRLLSVLNDHEDDVEMIAFDPSGTWLATASRDRRARLFDLEGRLLARFEGHTADVISVAWTADGKGLITSGDDGTVRWWDVNSGRQLHCVRMDGAETDTISLLGDGAVVAGNDRGELVLIQDGRSTTIRVHKAGIKRVHSHAGSGLLVSTSYDRSVYLWERDGDQLRLISQTVAPAPVWLRSVAFDADGALLFGTFGGGYASFDPPSGTWNLDLYRETANINAVLVQGAAVYTVGDAGNVRVEGRSLTNIGSLCNFLVGHRGRTVTGGQLGVLFDASTGEAIHSHHSPLNCGVSAGASGMLLVGAYTGEVLAFDGDLRFRSAQRIHTNAVKGLAQSDGRLFSVCANGDAAVHDAASLRLMRHIEHAHGKIANGACAVHGTGFASVGRDLALRLWTLDGESISTIPTPHRHSVKCVAADAGGRRIATGAYDGTIGIFDSEAGCWECTRPTTAGISSVAFDDSKSRFVAASYDGKIMWTG